ncbi:MAG: universal stress protein [Dehalococcoidales bacterium]
MFDKILVCLDGSKLAEQILPFAIQEAIRFESRLVLLRVAAPMPAASANYGVASEEMVKMKSQNHKEAVTYLERIAEEIQAERNVEIEYSVKVGLAAETIVEFAEQNRVGLIAIATHGEGGIKRLVFGSVADYVLRNANLPMLVIKPV